MTLQKKELSRTEWQLMNICWDAGKVSARDIYEKTLETKRRTYQAVKTMLDRLVDKGYLGREKFGPIWLYEPLVPRNAVVGREIDSFVTTVLDKTFAPLLAHFATKEHLSDEELKALKKLIENHEDDAQGK